MKIVRRVLFVLFLFLLTISVGAQNYEKNLNEEPVTVQNNRGNGDVTLLSTAPVQKNEELNRKVKELSVQLNQARESGNKELIKQIENQINNLVGRKVAVPGSGPQPVPLSESLIQGDGNNSIGISIITAGNLWGTATTTQNTDGRIWVATTHYAFGDADTLRIFYSDNGGLSWNYLTGWNWNQTGVDFLANDLDIEVLNDGSDWWIYITGGYSYNGFKSVFVNRYKDDGTGFFFMNLPQNGSTNQYWARIVSDYPRYTSDAYVYMVATMDSAMNATDKRIWSRAFVILDPYAATPTVSDRNHNQNGSSYWWFASSTPINTIAKSDVAYYDSLSEGSRIVTSTIFESATIAQNIYMTYSDNYMATVPYIGNFFSLIYKSSTPMMSFSGGNDNLKGCIATVRFYQDTLDADARYIATNNGGATWNQGYLDLTTDTTLKVDVIALKGVDGHFKFGWINRDAPYPEFLYNTGHLNGSMNLTSPVSMYGAGIYPDGVYGGRAGYRLTGSDSCFAVFEGLSGITAYGVSGCSGAVSVDKDEPLPSEYSLTQNYPNPFNPSTTIKYSIPEASFVNIKVFNLIGQEITELVNKELQKGNYEISFDATNLPSGVYFYRIKTDKFVETRKMMLMK